MDDGWFIFLCRAADSSIYGTVIVGNTVWIDGAIVLPGAKMSDGSIIGAMQSSLTKYRQARWWGEVPANILKIYNPASRKWELR